jgi:hypothetical protein
MCLAKASGIKDAEETSELLADLYDLRSKVVHGLDSNKEYKKVEPHVVKLRLISREGYGPGQPTCVVLPVDNRGSGERT